MPELVEVIALNLNKSDMYRLNRTSRLFLKAFAPQLWHTVNFWFVIPKYWFFRDPEPTLALARNTLHLRQLLLRTGVLLDIVDSMACNDDDYLRRAVPIVIKPDLFSSPASSTSSAQARLTQKTPRYLTVLEGRRPLSVILPHITQLKQFAYFDDQNTRHSIPYSVTSRISWMLILNPSLTSVKLLGLSLGSSLEIRLLAQALFRLVFLRILCLRLLGCKVRWKHVYPALFYSLPPSLEQLVFNDKGSTDRYKFEGLSTEQDMELTDGREGQPLPRRQTPLNRLTQLRITDIARKSAEFWCVFIEQCPSLEVIYMPSGMVGPSRAPFLEAVRKHCPRVVELL